MKPARVRLIDIGMQDDFDRSTAFAQSLVQSLLTRGNGSPLAEVELVRSRDFYVTSASLQAEAHVLHLMAHGDASPDDLGFWSDDGASGTTLSELAEQFATDGTGITASTLFADCCSSSRGRFKRAIRDCISGPTVYVGARRMIDWRESTTFASAFYAAYFKDRGRGLSSSERGMRAAERAVTGYEAIVDGACPFVVDLLTPSRTAKRSLA